MLLLFGSFMLVQSCWSIYVMLLFGWFVYVGAIMLVHVFMLHFVWFVYVGAIMLVHLFMLLFVWFIYVSFMLVHLPALPLTWASL